MLRVSQYRLYGNGRFGTPRQSQVLGAAVARFDSFPHRAQDTLRMYRSFWRLIYRLPPTDRRDAAFKLRNEFRSKQNMVGLRRISRAVAHGEAMLEDYRSRFASKEMRQDRPTQRGPASQSRAVDASQSERLWDRLQEHGRGVLPNLRNVKASKQMEEAYTPPRNYPLV